MSKHVYMSVGAKTTAGLFLDSFGAQTNVMNYRGVSEDSDIASFQRKMSQKGYIVVAENTPLANHAVTSQDDKDFVINYPSCFKNQMATLFPSGK